MESFNKWSFLASFVLIRVVCAENVHSTASDNDSHLFRVEATRFLDASKRFADAILEHGRDHYGPEQSPLFVDGLNVDSLESPRWLHEGENLILSNYSSQQPLYRLLDGLSILTGDPRYHEAAEAGTAHFLDKAIGPSGLPYWGFGASYDLALDRPFNPWPENGHTLYGAQPYYELMHRVNPAATQRILEAIWGAHVRDWAKLDFNRSASIRDPEAGRPQWDSPFLEDLEVPFESLIRNTLAFGHFSGSLMCAGGMLAILEDHEPARIWTRRLAWRWQQGNDPRTGLGGGMINHPPTIRREGLYLDRAARALNHVHPEINEGIMIAGNVRSMRYDHLVLMQMQIGDRLLKEPEPLAGLGRDLVNWAVKDLEAYAFVWEPADARFRSILIDGTPLQWERARPGYFTNENLAPVGPNGRIFWGYATAYRLAGKPQHWLMVRQLALAMGHGDLGPEEGGEGVQPFPPAAVATVSHWDLYAFLELYRATGREVFLEMAVRIGDNMLAQQSESGLFPLPGREWARTGDEIPLALLHLAAALEKTTEELPAPVSENTGFISPRPDSTGGFERIRDAEILYGYR